MITIPGFCGETLYFSFDSIEWLLVDILCIAGVYFAFISLEKMSTKLATAGVLLATVGLYGAEDLFTTYICFEIAGFLSVFWMTDKVTEQTNERLKRYLSWLVIPGMIMTMGMFLFSHYAETLVYQEFEEMTFHTGWYYGALICYLIGYGSRSGFLLLHSWMDSAYRECSLEKGMLFSVLLMPGGIWSLRKLLVYTVHDVDQWKSIEQFLYGIAILTILLGFYRIWCSREKGTLSGGLSMVMSGILLGAVTAVMGSERTCICLFIGYVIVIRILYGIISKKDWVPKNKLDLEWFSAENMVYEPLFLYALPFFFGVVFRLIDYAPDGLVALLRGTIYQDSKQRVWDKVGTPFTYVVGIIFDEIVHILNITFLRKRPIRKSFVNATAVARREWQVTMQIVTRSVSFGLMMFSVGMIIVLIYIML